MSPNQQGARPYHGPERRERHRRHEDLPPVKHGLFTAWQWAVLGSYFVAIVLSVAVGALANQALNNTERLDVAICAEIHYLERVVAVSQNPESAAALSGLIRELRSTQSTCPPQEHPGG